MRFQRAENTEGTVDLRIGTDWNQQQVVAEETVARMRNTAIHRILIRCVTCARPLIAHWRNAFNDRMPCRAAELCMAESRCLLNSGTAWQQLFQTFDFSKLGVLSYDISMFYGPWDDDSRAHFDAIWSAWDRATALFVRLLGKVDLSYFLEQLLREPEHGGRHYTVDTFHEPEPLRMLESYMEVSQFKAAEKG